MGGKARDPVMAELRRTETALHNAITKAKRQGYQIRTELRGDLPITAAYKPEIIG